MILHHAAEHYAGEIETAFGLRLSDVQRQRLIEIVREIGRARGDAVVDLALSYGNNPDNVEARPVMLAFAAQASKDYGNSRFPSSAR